MVKGGQEEHQVHLKKSGEDFVVYIDDKDEYEEWRKGDSSTPLSRFVGIFEVYTTNKQGNQGNKDVPSEGLLRSAFGIEEDQPLNKDKIIEEVLKTGKLLDKKGTELHGPGKDSGLH